MNAVVDETEFYLRYRNAVLQIARAIARQFRYRVEIEDLFQEGCIGLLHAARNPVEFVAEIAQVKRRARCFIIDAVRKQLHLARRVQRRYGTIAMPTESLDPVRHRREASYVTRPELKHDFDQLVTVARGRGFDELLERYYEGEKLREIAQSRGLHFSGIAAKIERQRGVMNRHAMRRIG